ncbi:CobW family GTP-binding protein [Actinomadura hibisca]|uniref:CobW family GTP-binding protein n=1 Tax=Actinomadura hibisca TaxID=68565 RepID=UPI00082DDADF|nr:GTP-binding protein [Actinomadura hibisca]
MSVPVVLVAGFHGPARGAVVDRLLRERPGALAVHHDLRAVAGGAVVRTVRDATGVRDRAVVRLEHGCVTCAVRLDLLPQLLRHAPNAELLIVELWDTVEPRPVAEVLAHGSDGELRLAGVFTALDAELAPLDLCRGEPLAEIGKPGAAGDRRYLAEVLFRQIEYATALVLPDVLPAPIPAADSDDVELCRELMGHLAPMTPVHLPGDLLPVPAGTALCPHDLAARIDPATAQLPPEASTPAADTVVWRRTGPLHPARFFDAVDELAAESVRSRGRFWLGNRPDRMLAWDAAAGVVAVQDAGPWLACLPEAAWEMVPPLRRAAAALDWHAEHGDRVQHLVFTGAGLDRARIHRLLDSCLLADGEEPADLEDSFAPILDTKGAA